MRPVISPLIRSGSSSRRGLLPRELTSFRPQIGLPRRPLPPTWNHNNFSSFQQQQEFSIWSWFSPKPQQEQEQQVEAKTTVDTALPMPARRENNNTVNNNSNHKNNPLYDSEIISLLESPLGTFEPSTWFQAKRFLQYLVDTKEDINEAFRLLDRMVQEPHAGSHVSHDTIYMVVQQWLTLYSKQQKRHTKAMYYSNNQQPQQPTPTSKQQQQVPIIPPSDVWRRIKYYGRNTIMESSTYHRILEGTSYAKKLNNGPLLAENILESMLTGSQQETPTLRPSTYTFNCVMASWEGYAAASQTPTHYSANNNNNNMSSNNNGGGDTANAVPHHRALALLQQLKGLYEAGWGEELKPNRDAYRRVMNLFAHQGDGDQVEALLEELYAMYLDNEGNMMVQQHLKPTTKYFSLVLYAWSRSKDPLAAERAVVLLDRMLELEASEEIPGLQVNAACFNIVMVCWSRLRTKESAATVQSIFDRLVELSKTDTAKTPIGGSYMALIHTWSPIDPEKAEAAFWKWKEEHDQGTCEIRLDSKLFSTLVGGWYNSKVPNRAERCDALLQYALATDSDLKFEPTVVVFNMTINAWCRKGTVEGVERGEALLRQMESVSSNSSSSSSYFSCRPTIGTYVPIIQSWAVLGQVDRAEGLLRECFETSHRQEEVEGRHSKTKKQHYLDTRTFNYVLKGWLSKANVPRAKALPEAAERAEELLLNMPRLGVKPNLASFQYVLDARRRSRSRYLGVDEYVTTPPKVQEVLSLLDHEHRHGGLGTSETGRVSYLTVRQGWSLLAV